LVLLLEGGARGGRGGRGGYRRGAVGEDESHVDLELVERKLAKQRLGEDDSDEEENSGSEEESGEEEGEEESEEEEEEDEKSKAKVTSHPLTFSSHR